VDTSAKQQATSIHPLPGWGKINTHDDEKKKIKKDLTKYPRLCYKLIRKDKDENTKS